ncbi:MAG TPA: hypothetical protein GX708_15910 [Gallicola sp.]|jgi:predicted AlkP superfamily phosphohydrolase/phosphomutase|nr:hypothetical protein [Gallicola sp.]
MSKLIIIGIDGLDSNLISKFEESLPNFKKLKLLVPNVKLTSVYPYDSETAWSTIYTGLNPAKHGVVVFKNPFDNLTTTSSLVDAESDIRKRLKGITFWDYASKAGKKVCVLFPHAVYPAWQVNGTMICRSMKGNNKNYPIQSFPSSISKEYISSNMNSVRSLPTKNTMNNYIELCKKLVFDEIELGLKMLCKDEWDLFFIYSSAGDAIQHVFWNYCDDNDPTYPGNNEYQNVIEDFYKYYDKMLGSFMEKMDENDTLLLLSDHGHGMRPMNLVNFNEMLRERGYLESKVKNENKTDRYYIFEKLKDNLSEFVVKYGLSDITAKFVKIAPITKKVYTASLSIDWNKSVACASDPNGIKAYSYGGIAINRNNLSMDYEDFRNLLIREFSIVSHPVSGKNLIKWMCKREELYQGTYLGKYPDIVFELDQDFGVGWGTHVPLISKSHTHLIQPGGHLRDSAVFLISKKYENIRQKITLEDIFPTVLQILNIQEVINCDGSSIFVENKSISSDIT